MAARGPDKFFISKLSAFRLLLVGNLRICFIFYPLVEGNDDEVNPIHKSFGLNISTERHNPCLLFWKNGCRLMLFGLTFSGRPFHNYHLLLLLTLPLPGPK